jgi:hypothetical protein
MQHFVYSVRYSVVPINSSLLPITLCCSVRTTFVCNDTKYFVVSVITEFDCICVCCRFTPLFSVILESTQRYTVRDRRRHLHAMYVLMLALVGSFVLPTLAVQVTSKPRPTEPMTAACEAFEHSNLCSPVEWRAIFLNDLVTFAHIVKFYEWYFRFRPILHGSVLCLQFHIC